MTEDNRRPLKSRGTRWAASISGLLRRRGVRPNQISVASVFMAAGAGACLALLRFTDSNGVRAALFLLAAVGIQLRLLCNLFDGMVAVEGGLKSPSGEIYNDLPDRLADPLILACAGYSIAAPSLHGVELGFAAAVLAVLTAYVRVLGASAGTPHYFIGPMAKQHRMAVVTFGCLFSIPEVMFLRPGRVMAVALGVVALGCVVTVCRRVSRIVRRLES